MALRPPPNAWLYSPPENPIAKATQTSSPSQFGLKTHTAVSGYNTSSVTPSLVAFRSGSERSSGIAFTNSNTF